LGDECGVFRACRAVHVKLQVMKTSWAGVEKLQTMRGWAGLGARLGYEHAVPTGLAELCM